jgi:NAD-dependent SIR2 family protein deacetylase
MSESHAFELAAEKLRCADAVLISAGAGMGVDSGLPDFRGVDGFWKAYPRAARLGLSFEELANPEWFRKDPRLAWAFYGHRLNLYRQTAPHRGFKQLLEIADAKDGGFFVFTSNVDGQFQKAGYPSDRIAECHGSIHHFQCSGPCSGHIWDAAGIEVKVDEESFEAAGPLPSCPECGKIARPNILMFGDWSWVSTRSCEQRKCLDAWLQSAARNALRVVIVEMGAGTSVATVRWQSSEIIRRTGATLIRINPRDFEVPAGPHIALPVGAAEGVNAICSILMDRK